MPITLESALRKSDLQIFQQEQVLADKRSFCENFWCLLGTFKTLGSQISRFLQLRSVLMCTSQGYIPRYTKMLLECGACSKTFWKLLSASGCTVQTLVWL